MFESLLSIESLLAISVGAIFSFRVGKLNLSLRNNVRLQSPDVYGNNNQIIYNETMMPVRKEMAFSVKVCAVVMMALFHVYPLFFANLVFSLSFTLPFFCLVGVINSIRLNGIGQGWDVLYCLASFIMGAFFYCSGVMMLQHVSLYPQPASLYDYFSNYRFIDWLNPSRQMHAFMLIIWSSIACPALILVGFYLAFAYTKARDGNNAFRFSFYMLTSGYVAYLFLSGALFSPERSVNSNFASYLTLPFKILLLVSPF